MNSSPNLGAFFLPAFCQVVLAWGALALVVTPPGCIEHSPSRVGSYNLRVRQAAETRSPCAPVEGCVAILATTVECGMCGL